MKQTSRSIITYVLMMLFFGTLIYFAIEEGDRFLSYTNGMGSVKENSSSFIMFTESIKQNVGHRLSTLLIQIVVILITVKIFGFLFKYIGQPSVIGEIVAGIVLGPPLLGHFSPGIFDFIFPGDSLTNLNLLSQIGLVLYMFAV